MNIFLSKYINNLDKKGRVSVPASFRQVIGSQPYNGLIAYPSFRNNCIEACSLPRLGEISEIIKSLDPYSPAREAFETIILGQAVQLPFDAEGRITLPRPLLDHAGMLDHACFVGKGEMFEIWQPERFDLYLEEARKLAENNRLSLKNDKKI